MHRARLRAATALTAVVGSAVLAACGAGSTPQEWPDDRFDVVWSLTETPDGWQFAQLPELVLPQDQTGVIPS
jgi:hypothetical protein